MSSTENLKGIHTELETEVARAVHAIPHEPSREALDKLANLFVAFQAVTYAIDHDLPDPGPRTSGKPGIYILG